MQLRAARGENHVGCPLWWQCLPVEIGVIEKVHAVDDDALLCGGFPQQHVATIRDARVLLDHLVARARRDVVAVGPHRGSGVIGEQRSQKLVAVVRAERIGARTHGIAHRVRPLFFRWPRRPDATGGVGRLGRRRRHGGWNEERRRGARLAGHSRRTHVRPALRLRLPHARLIGALGAAREDRHHDEPAIRELIVAHDGVAVVVRFARSTEPLEERIRGDRTVYDRAVLAKDRYARVDDLDHVVRPHGQRVIGRVASFPAAVRPLQPHTKTIEARDECGWGTPSLFRLLDRGAGGNNQAGGQQHSQDHRCGSPTHSLSQRPHHPDGRLMNLTFCQPGYGERNDGDGLRPKDGRMRHDGAGGPEHTHDHDYPTRETDVVPAALLERPVATARNIGFPKQPDREENEGNEQRHCRCIVQDRHPPTPPRGSHEAARRGRGKQRDE